MHGRWPACGWEQEGVVRDELPKVLPKELVEVDRRLEPEILDRESRLKTWEQSI
jgi:hypothetical protein